MIKGKMTNTNKSFAFGSTKNIMEKKYVPLSDQGMIIKSRKKMSSIIKNNGPRDHAYKIYSLTIEDNTQRMTTKSTH